MCFLLGSPPAIHTANRGARGAGFSDLDARAVRVDRGESAPPRTPPISGCRSPRPPRPGRARRREPPGTGGTSGGGLVAVEDREDVVTLDGPGEGVLVVLLPEVAVGALEGVVEEQDHGPVRADALELPGHPFPG